jgi:uncharacterized membrane protein
MKKRQIIFNALVVLFAISPIAYLLISWNAVPEIITFRFNVDQPVNKTQTRVSLLIFSVVVSITSVVVHLLMRNLKKFDPKVKSSTPMSGFNKMGLSVTIFLVLLNYFFILSAVHSWEVSKKAIFIFSGLLLAVIGNYGSNIKPNFFAGIRLPWTLSDENNWRQTHHLAGKLWFWGGLLLALVSIILPDPSVKPAFLSIGILLILIPCIYSYKLFKNKK